LKKHGKHLLLVIKIERYEKESYRSKSKYIHSVAIVRISNALDLQYFKGRINHLHKSPW